MLSRTWTPSCVSASLTILPRLEVARFRPVSTPTRAGDSRDIERGLQTVAELPSLVLTSETTRIHDEPLAIHDLQVRRRRREHHLAPRDHQAMLVCIDPDLL